MSTVLPSVLSTGPRSEPADIAARAGRRLSYRVAAMVLATGLGITATLAMVTHQVNASTEHRLLAQRVREATAVLSTAVSAVQTPLAAGAELVEGTGADRASFERLMAPSVGAGKSFSSVSVWRTDGSTLRPVVLIGEQPSLVGEPSVRIRSFLGRVTSRPSIVVYGILGGARGRIGYGYSSPRTPNSFVVYAEGALPANRTAVVQKGSAYSNLDYALYLNGLDGSGQTLLYASTPQLPLAGDHAGDDVAFGDRTMHLVMTAREPLTGWLPHWLWVWIAAAGMGLSLGAMVLTGRLVSDRDRAKRLAAQNALLLEEQRTVAHTLQRSLLPIVETADPALEVATRYQAGALDAEIGGDWYDVMEVAPGRFLLAVGDVSGRGLEAATLMASLRFAIRAFASQGDLPATILTRVGRLIDVGRDGHFATVLCAVLDSGTGQLTVASAGHPPPLVIHCGEARFLPLPVGPPVGVASGRSREAATFTLAPGTVLLGFTDGLFERRDETVDDGLERLRQQAQGWRGTVDGLLSDVLQRLAHDGSQDDTAVLGVRWAGATTVP